MEAKRERAGEMSPQSYTQPAMSAPARSPAAGRRSRVLLIHANPFQRVTPVPAYGLEQSARAFAKIIDEVNKLPLTSLRVNIPAGNN